MLRKISLSIHDLKEIELILICLNIKIIQINFLAEHILLGEPI